LFIGYRYTGKEIQYINTFGVCQITHILDVVYAQFANPFAVMDAISNFKDFYFIDNISSESLHASSGLELLVKERSFQIDKRNFKFLMLQKRYWI